MHINLILLLVAEFHVQLSHNSYIMCVSIKEEKGPYILSSKQVNMSANFIV